MITLKNERLELTVRPDLGGRIDSFRDRASGRDWVWHPEHYDGAERDLPLGASFDANWTGGWEEMFPSDTAGEFRGLRLVDHGELWSQSWRTIEADHRGIKMALQCQTVPVMVEKSFSLDPERPRVVIDYWFKNQSTDEIPFLYKLHPALRIEAGDEILMPACTIEPVTLDFSTILGRDGKSRFPHGTDRDGRDVAINRVLARDAGEQEFVYCSDLAEGWCGMRDHRSGAELIIEFDRRELPYVWLFASYGKFNGHHVMMLEPATTIPYDLEEAIRRGTAASLAPKETRRIGMAIGVVPAR